MNMRERSAHATKLLAQEPPPLDTLLYLGEVFGLTQCELRIVGYIAQGMHIKHIARIMGWTTTSVRTYAKRALCKTDTHSQAQLVRLVFRATDGVAA